MLSRAGRKQQHHEIQHAYVVLNSIIRSCIGDHLWRRRYKLLPAHQTALQFFLHGCLSCRGGCAVRPAACQC